MVIIGDSDFRLDVKTVTVMPEGDTDVSIVFKHDEDYNELDETLTLTLVPKPFTLQTFPHGEAVFFINTINLTILNAKGIVHNLFCCQWCLNLYRNTFCTPHSHKNICVHLTRKDFITVRSRTRVAFNQYA